MPQRPAVYRPPGLAAAASRRPPDTRPTASQRGYDARWQRARLSHLADHPLCVRCDAAGRVTEATVVDHVVPHRGDDVLFWDRENWQSLCGRCHGQKTATEDGGFGHARATR